ncbi:MAG: hypothetical protein B6D59_07685 [Campylobacteraceae bacterium 4484_4]|nr:MAG: hypothetical protein B6D59_07685 [Campylobacteraceae bacterium 4484_4]
MSESIEQAHIKQTAHVKHIEPYTPEFETMIPTGFVKFMRTCVIWQFIRFLVINAKMTIVILKSHH